MISFKNFLKEDSSELTFEDGLEQIKQHCQPFIRQTKEHGPLLRGLKYASNKKILHAAHPTDRAPKDSDSEFNRIFNDAFAHLYAVDNIRRKTVFASGSFRHARIYGTVYFYLPAGDFEFAWSPKISDSYEDFSDLLDIGIKQFCAQNGFSSRAIGGGLLARTINRLVIGLDNTVNIFSDKLSEHDRYFVNSSASAANWPDAFVDELSAAGLDIATASVKMAEYAFRESYLFNSALGAAIDSGHETMFFKSDGYYLVPYSVVVEKAEEEKLLSMTDDNLYRFLLSKINN